MTKKQTRQHIETAPVFHNLSAIDKFASKSVGYGDAEQNRFTSESRAIDRDRSERNARKRRTLALAGKSALAVAGLTVATGIAGVVGSRDLASQHDMRSTETSAIYTSDTNHAAAESQPQGETAAQPNEEHRRHQIVVQHTSQAK